MKSQNNRRQKKLRPGLGVLATAKLRTGDLISVTSTPRPILFGIGLLVMLLHFTGCSPNRSKSLDSDPKNSAGNAGQTGSTNDNALEPNALAPYGTAIANDPSHWPFPIATESMPRCSKEFKGPRSKCYKEWAVFVYMSADNNLEKMALDDLKEMSQVGSSPSVDFVVQTDLYSQKGIWRYHIQKGFVPRPDKAKIEFPGPDSKFGFRPGPVEKMASAPDLGKTGPKSKERAVNVLIESPSKTSKSSSLDSVKTSLRPEEILPEMNSGNQTTLREFMEWGLEKYPSKKKMLIIWSHGMGFSGGISVDDTSNGAAIGLKKLAASLHYFKNFLLDGNPIDIYASDACLMQSLEVIYEIGTYQNLPAGQLPTKPVVSNARYLIGSANVELPDGWPYNTIFRFMTRHPFDRKQSAKEGEGVDSATGWAKQIPHSYFASYRYTDGGSTMTSVVLPTHLPSSSSQPWNLKTALKNYVKALRSIIKTDPQHYYLLLQEGLGITLRSDPDSGDLAYFSAILLAKLKSTASPNSDLSNRLLDNFVKADGQLYNSLLQMLVIGQTRVSSHKRNRTLGLDLPMEAYQGLSIWLPYSYFQYIGSYDLFKESSLLLESGWLELMKDIWNFD